MAILFGACIMGVVNMCKGRKKALCIDLEALRESMEKEAKKKEKESDSIDKDKPVSPHVGW